MDLHIVRIKGHTFTYCLVLGVIHLHIVWPCRSYICILSDLRGHTFTYWLVL